MEHSYQIRGGCLLYGKLDLILHRHHSSSTMSFETRMYPIHLAGVKGIELGMHVPKDGVQTLVAITKAP